MTHLTISMSNLPVSKSRSRCQESVLAVRNRNLLKICSNKTLVRVPTRFDVFQSAYRITEV